MKKLLIILLLTVLLVIPCASAITNDLTQYVNDSGWAAWTPTLTWTGGPANVTSTIARWTQIGRVVFFDITIRISNGTGATGLTITLPATVGGSSANPIFQGLEYVGGIGYNSPIAYSAPSSNLLTFATFVTMANGQACSLNIGGKYEVDLSGGETMTEGEVAIVCLLFYVSIIGTWIALNLTLKKV